VSGAAPTESESAASSAPRARVGGPIVNAMTIDVEDYFQVSAFERHIPRDSWPARECRVERNVERILAMLDAHGRKATFFTLGWVADRYPALVRAIVEQGHELASHGQGHQRVSDLDQAAFFADIDRAKRTLEDIAGVAVGGYRAPSFSIGAQNLWAFDVLARAGYRYSSSVYPVAHDHYGMPDAPRFAHMTASGVYEIPPSTVRLGARNLPSSGGGWFRLLPYAASRWLLQRINEGEGQPAIFYFHPWEIDAEQPRVPGIDAKTRFRHYLNLDRVPARLNRLLADFAWDRMDRVFPLPSPTVH
jgi:polysaccharide deacetylase family protein (PEP-CTERM system associated)